MDNVVEFPKEKPEECLCDSCQLADEFLEYATYAETKEELKEVLRDLVEESFNLGFRECLLQDMDLKLDLLNKLTE